MSKSSNGVKSYFVFGSKPVAVVTGASSGIGYELAKILFKEKFAVVLVARSEDKLNELACELEPKRADGEPSSVWVLPLDLSRPEHCDELYRQVTEKMREQTGNPKATVDVLVNNAGFGSMGKFEKIEWSKEAQMIDLNVRALTHLTKLFGKDMVAAGRGRIMNVASVAAFQPGPLMAVYYATKHYVLAFSEAIAEEWVGTGVTVTSLCPGPTTSGFMKVAGVDERRLTQKLKLPSSKTVAQYGFKAMMDGKRVAVHGVLNTMITQTVKFVPRTLVTKMVKGLQST